MRLFLLRHGTADPRGGPGPDEDRALVAKGKEQCRQAARLLARVGREPGAILSSPYRRALDSAEVVAKTLGWDQPITVEPSLAPGAPAAAACQAILSPSNLASETVLVVGHEPLLSSLAGHLLDCPGLGLDLRKGGVIELRILVEPRPQGILVGVLRPGHLRRV